MLLSPFTHPLLPPPHPLLSIMCKIESPVGICSMTQGLNPGLCDNLESGVDGRWEGEAQEGGGHKADSCC